MPWPEEAVEAWSKLTGMQLRMWTGQKMMPEAPTYNIVLTFSIHGDVEPDHFRQAFQAVVERSDALRMVIEEVGGIPRQRVVGQVQAAVDLVDLSAVPEPQAAFEAWREHRAPILLHPGERLFDTALVKLGQDHFIWYLNQHHIISDGWSCALVYRRVAEYYEMSLRGQLAQAPALPAFRRYIDWEGAHADSTPSERMKIPGPPTPVVEVKPTRPHESGPRNRASQQRRVSSALGVERTRRLKALARSDGIRSHSEHLSLLGILSAVLLTYLHRTTDNRRLAVGMVLHNRTEETRDTIGLFMEMLPVQVEIAVDETFHSLVRKSMGEAWQIQRQAQRGGRQHLGRQAYDVVLNYANVSFPDFHGLPTEATWVHTGFGDAHRSLFLHVHDLKEADDLALSLDAREAVFSQDLQQRIVAQFLEILDQMLENPMRPIGQVGLRPASPHLSPLEQSWAESDTLASGQPGGRRDLDRPLIAPRDDLESQLVSIWERVLDIQPIGVQDDLFEMDVDSLPATRLVVEIGKEFGVNLPIEILLQAPTIEQVARILRQDMNR